MRRPFAHAAQGPARPSRSAGPSRCWDHRTAAQRRLVRALPAGARVPVGPDDRRMGVGPTRAEARTDGHPPCAGGRRQRGHGHPHRPCHGHPGHHEEGPLHVPAHRRDDLPLLRPPRSGSPAFAQPDPAVGLLPSGPSSSKAKVRLGCSRLFRSSRPSVFRASPLAHCTPMASLGSCACWAVSLARALAHLWP